MAEIILYHKGAYNVYSTISDAPIFESAITLAQLESYIQKRHGRVGYQTLPERLQRAHESGSSGFVDDDLESAISANRAGPNESHLTVRQFVDQYLTPEHL